MELRSLVVLLIWIYYSAQILFFGAAFTHVYAEEYGPNPKAPGANRSPREKDSEHSKGKPEPALASGHVPGQDEKESVIPSPPLSTSVPKLLGIWIGFARSTIRLFQGNKPE